MRFLLLSIGVILGIGLQSTWLSNLGIVNQLKPDLILIMVISYGLLKGSESGTAFGLVSGFVMDLFSGNVIGIGALIKMIAGFSAGLLEKNIFKDNLLIPALVTFVWTIVLESFNVIIRLVFKANFNFLTVFISIIVPLAIYNALLAPIIYQLLIKMEQFLAERS